MNLTENEIIKILEFIGILHLVLALLSMLELKLIPFYTPTVKVLWFILIWMLPLIGPVLFHLAARYGWRKIEL